MNETVAGSAFAIAEYRPSEAGLAELRSRLTNIVYDLATKDGNNRARRDRQECIRLRVALEDVRVREKAPLLERQRLLDAEAKRLTAEILAVEKPIDTAIKEYEAKVEAERVEKARVEAERVAAIANRIQDIRLLPYGQEGKSAADLRETIASVDLLVVTDELFAEFKVAADAALTECKAKLGTMLAARVVHEFERDWIEASNENLRRDKEALAKEQKAHAAKLAATPPTIAGMVAGLMAKGVAAQQSVDAVLDGIAADAAGHYMNPAMSAEIEQGTGRVVGVFVENGVVVTLTALNTKKPASATVHVQWCRKGKKKREATRDLLVGDSFSLEG